ncbi:hypothetical protein HBI42_069490 [Parastagonospora nodorum]|nr:hypothetical protein HBI68_036640 [Parastagonospora nodorum]KAH6224170.1 hypothetical protein HBI43_079210 [Parastagonospora nodorum]KAH6263843.1 hypothetical protein HBI42_069490 [Parastagonospora nodorum]
MTAAAGCNSNNSRTGRPFPLTAGFLPSLEYVQVQVQVQVQLLARSCPPRLAASGPKCPSFRAPSLASPPSHHQLPTHRSRDHRRSTPAAASEHGHALLRQFSSLPAQWMKDAGLARRLNTIFFPDCINADSCTPAPSSRRRRAIYCHRPAVILQNPFLLDQTDLHD